MSEQIRAEDFANALAKVLVNYGEACDQEVEKEAQTAMKELVRETKKEAPFNPHGKGSHYRDQITSRKIGKGKYKHSFQWYVKGDKYRLAHLLDKGHTKRGGGRTPGDGHVTRNAERIIGEYYSKVREAIARARP